MADPLSVSASLAGLVSIADIVFRRSYKYVKSAKEAKKEIAALSSETASLSGTLQSLQLVASQLESDNQETSVYATRLDHVFSCQQTLEKMKLKLDKHEMSSIGDDRLESTKRRLK